MIYETIGMSEKFPQATLTTYVPDEYNDVAHHTRPAIIVCPGGGYSFLSDREAEPIASVFIGLGFNVFVLRYTIKADAAGYAPLLQAAHAVTYVRENAEKYYTDPKRIFISGFSAGGHLAASAGILWNHPVLKKEFEGKPEGINRPDGMILCYPVITGGRFAHRGSIEHVSGVKNYGEAEAAEWSLELHVDGTTPPAFIWHTAEDNCVPVENSLMLASALSANKISFELHIYPRGCHGLALANAETANGRAGLIVPHLSDWPQLAAKWIRDFFPDNNN